MGKMDRLKRRRAEKVKPSATPTTRKRQAAPPPPKPEERILPEQRDKGIWAEAKGFDMREKPVINVGVDMIGRLGHEKALTPAQVDAARQFQEVYAGWVAEMGTHGYGSCLADNTGGYDAGDGDVKAVRRYNALCERVGRIKIATLKLECEKGPEGKPANLAVLRNALDAVGA